MNNDQTRMQAAGLFFIRTLLGIIFFMQGYGKVFTFSVSKVYDMFFKEIETTFLPKWIIVFAAYYTSYIELICGFLLIIGLFRKYAMYFLAIDLLIVSFGHGVMEPIWDLSHVIPRAILLASLFLLPTAWDKWNVDSLTMSER
ncbi:MAG TPA: DoxX family protein [Puia sp.]|jgi:putative oxidoreductase|nr:DoxX family protein [Puia sp.]